MSKMHDNVKIFSLLQFVITSVKSKELKQLIFIWRHGNRSPVRDYPNYEKDYCQPFNKIWPKGQGQLTIHGLKQHYELGQWIRQTYKDFIPNDFNVQDIYIQSTDVDRTLMSATANMAALFPNQDISDPAIDPVHNFNSTLFNIWQPLPIHTIAKERDYTFRIPNRGCPNYHKWHKQATDGSEMYQKMNLKHEKMLKLLQTNGGFPANFTVELDNIWEMTDPIKVSYEHGLGLPKWLSQENYQNMINLWGDGVYPIFADFEDVLHTKMTRINAGKIIETLQYDMGKMLDKNFGDDSDGGDPLAKHKIRVYSAHDTTITGFLIGIKQFNYLQPPYASSLIFELYDDESINLLFRNDTTKDPVQIPLCNSKFITNKQCYYENWKTQTEHLVPGKNFIAECGLESHEYQNQLFWTFSLLILTWLYLAINFVYKRVKNSNTNEKRNTDDDHRYYPADDQVVEQPLLAE